VGEEENKSSLMKIKTINLNQASGSTSRKSKWYEIEEEGGKEEIKMKFSSWTLYHRWINSRRCNKAMTVVFCLTILGLFAGMIVLTISRTNRADARSLCVDK
jgi:hypothetical protein